MNKTSVQFSFTRKGVKLPFSAEMQMFLKLFQQQKHTLTQLNGYKGNGNAQIYDFVATIVIIYWYVHIQ